MRSRVIELLNRYVSRSKGSDFRVDPRIGPGDLAGTILERGTMKVRGLLRFPLRSPKPFVGSRVTIRARRHLRFGTGVIFGHRCLVDALSADGVTIGNHVHIGRNTRIECTGNLRTLGTGLTVGDNVGMGTDCLYGCAGGIEVGADTIVGNYVTFHAENHEIDDIETPIRLQGVSHQGIVIGRNCWIGAKATILDGAHIGDGCVIAAGSVVTAGTYPANHIYGGVPARMLRPRSPEGTGADSERR